jgi:hypothetical protein
MARRESEPSTLTWIWLWDALQLLLEHYPRPLAEEKLRRAILSKDVRSKDVIEGRKIRGAGRRFWRRLSGSNDPRLHSAAADYENSWIEAYDQEGRCRVYVQVALEDVQQLLPEGVLSSGSGSGAGAGGPRGKRQGRQIDRVYRELRVQFPPHGKPPARMPLGLIGRKLAPGWKDENKQYGLTDPSRDVIAAAVKQVGRAAVKQVGRRSG